MKGVDLVMLVAVLTLGAAALARRLKTPAPVTLASLGIGAGVVWRLVPGLPVLRLPPDLVLFIFLPPLIASAAYRLPLAAFWQNRRPIAVLAIGLVIATGLGAAAVVHWMLGITWLAALTFGTVVAPPDPVAATSVASSVGLPHQLVTVLEGEGLVNDAVAITSYHLMIAAAAGTLGWSAALTTVSWQPPVGIAIGFFTGWVSTRLRRHLDDTSLEAAVSILGPYVTYALAERAHASTILALVTFGFALQRYRNSMASAVVRLSTRAVWSAIEFASAAIVFFLLGLFIGQAVVDVEMSSSLLTAGVAVTLAIIVIRLAFLFLVPSAMLRRVGERRSTVDRRRRAVLGWAGMRGVVSLALVLALPSLPDGRGADQRGALILLTFATIVGTLIGQGATLALVIARLGVGDPDRDLNDEDRIRRRACRAGIAAVNRAARGNGDGAGADQVATAVRDGYLGIGARCAPLMRQAPGLVRLVLTEQQKVITTMHDAGRISSALAQRLGGELDVQETEADGESGRLVSDE